MSELAELKQQLSAQQANLDDVNNLLAEYPDLDDAVQLKSELLAQMKETNDKIQALKPPAESTESPAEEVPVQKWRKEDHPAFRKTATATPPQVEERKDFVTGDKVSAKYHADKSFYPAVIMSVLGSKADPIYTVKFTGYSGTETVRSHEIRALPSSHNSGAQKRKADGSSVVANPSAAAPAKAQINTPGMISSPANIDSELASALRQPSKATDGPARPEPIPKKVKTNKALEKSKASWKDWQNKSSTGKMAKHSNKESMFRTGESATARVGFTGSGHNMRKDASRTRHTYQLDDD